MSNEYIFVYGTLRSESNSQMHNFLKSHSTFFTNGFLYGELFLVSYYPGVILSSDVSKKVYGEIYEIQDSEMILRKIDDYEECSDSYPEPQEYQRKKVPIFNASGKLCHAWVYVYCRETTDLKKISSGDFYKARH